MGIHRSKKGLAVPLICASILCLPTMSPAQPSTKLKAALDSGVEAVPERADRPIYWLTGVLRSAQVAGIDVTDMIAVEYDAGKPKHKLRLQLPVGTLRQQVDKIAEGAGCKWQADGDWINLVPKDKADDPKYVMNLKIPGKIVLSRDPSVATSIKGWLAEHHISISRQYVGLMLEPQPEPGLEKIEMENPTLRQYFNAHERLYGDDRWTVEVKVIRGKDAGSPDNIILTVWGQDTKALVKKAKREQQAKESEAKK